mgnify:CR=1 FL=1
MTMDGIIENVFLLRTQVCGVLMSFCGLFLPMINTARSVILTDLESQREYLTYWTIYICTEVFISVFGLLYPSALARYPPELKVGWVMWLTSPQHQGALRIYVFLIKPLFDSVEKRIDDTLEDLWARFWARLYKLGKVVVWQIAFAPQDDMLAQGLKSTARAGVAMYHKLEDDMGTGIGLDLSLGK